MSFHFGTEMMECFYKYIVICIKGDTKMRQKGQHFAHDTSSVFTWNNFLYQDFDLIDICLLGSN